MNDQPMAPPPPPPAPVTRGEVETMIGYLRAFPPPPRHVLIDAADLLRRLARYLAVLAVLLASCVHPIPPVVLPPAGPGLATLQVEVCEAEHCTPGPDEWKVTTARVTIGDQTPTVDGAGNAHFDLAPGVYLVSIEALGYEPVRDRIVTLPASGHVERIALTRDAPWTHVTEAELLRWRGAIATVTAPIPCGPRPGDPSNVVFTAEYLSPCYDDPAVRATMRAAYQARGYRQWALNPPVAAGYHGHYPAIDDRGGRFSLYLDRVEELWRDGLIPVPFLIPDVPPYLDHGAVDWAAVERDLTPLYQQPRAQAMFRLVVAGWEPDWSAADWQRAVAWMARVFPGAIRGVHFPPDHAAPCRGDDLVIAGGPYADEGACWAPVMPRVHLWLVQTGSFGGGTFDEGRTREQQFCYDAMDAVRHAEGYAGWPSTSARGGPMAVVAFEYASYWVYQARGSESEAQAWGNLALLCAPGLAGYGDGGTIR